MPILSDIQTAIDLDKKVLLRERKSHTTRRLAGARCVALSPRWEGRPSSSQDRGGGDPHPVLTGGGGGTSSNPII